MSKAFTKEGDGDDEEIADRAIDFKNYVTPRGFAVMRDELRQLMRVERPKVVEVVSWAAGNGDRSENGDYIYGKKRLREIDRRARYLTKSLESAVVVDPAQQKNRDQIFFGATVHYVRVDELPRTTKKRTPSPLKTKGLPSGESPSFQALSRRGRGRASVEHSLTIVGVDEAEMAQGKVSWISPIAKALLKARVGDEVAVRTPSGVERIEILAIEYDFPSPPRGGEGEKS